MNKPNDFTTGLLVGLFFGGCLGALIAAHTVGYAHMETAQKKDQEFKQQAVNAGAGMWVVDQSTGKVEFTFISAATPVGAPSKRNWTETDVTRKP